MTEEDSWFHRHRHAATLAAVLLVVAGIAGATRLRQEVFPPFAAQFVTVSVAYPGAMPDEIMDAVITPLETAVSGLEGIRTVRSFGRIEHGVVLLQVEEGTDARDVADAVQRSVSAIEGLPDAADEPTVSIDRQRDPVASVVVFGDASPPVLRASAGRIAAAMDADPLGLTAVLEADAIELGVQVEPDFLWQHELGIQDLAALIRSQDERTPLGSLGELDGSQYVSLAAPARATRATELGAREVILPRTGPVRIDSIGRVSESWSSTEREVTFGGRSAVVVQVYNDTGARPADAADRVRSITNEFDTPEGVDAIVWADTSREFSDRLALVQKNGVIGLALVLLVLGLLVSARVAFWTAMGIPVVMLGSLALWGAFDISLNQMSLFALLIALGIVVDDAIVVGESIASAEDDLVSAGDSVARAPSIGLRRVIVPVVAAVVTNVIAFLPLIAVPGELGVLFAQLGLVVILALVVSLAEALALLPAHLAPGRSRTRRPGNARDRIGRRALTAVGHGPVRAGVAWGCRHPIAMTLLFVAATVVLLSPVLNGTVEWRFAPRVESAEVSVDVVLPAGTGIAESRVVRSVLERSASRAARDLRLPGAVALSTIGGVADDAEEQVATVPGPHVIRSTVAIGPSGTRDFDAATFAARWLDAIEESDVAVSPRASWLSLGGGAEALVIELGHEHDVERRAAAARLETALANHPAVRSVVSSESTAARVSLSEDGVAASIGVSRQTLMRQIGAAVSGSRVHRFTAMGGEFETMVRVEAGAARNQDDLAQLPIRTGNGDLVPLSSVACMVEKDATLQETRRDGRPISVLIAFVDESAPGGEDLEDVLLDSPNRPAGLDVRLAGESEEEGRALTALAGNGLVALLAMYLVLALPLRSLVQPLVLVLLLPLGLGGAVTAHSVMGLEFSMVSVLGAMALCGVLVNDGLILMHAANALREQGLPVAEAASRAAARRCRPVLLTTITTAAGLGPLVFESAEQAQFLVPLALSLAGGLLVASPVMLFVIPVLHRVISFRVGD